MEKKSILKSGDKIFLVKPGGGINLELIKMVVFLRKFSTTSCDDSFYKDKRISKKLSRDERKTYVKNWGFWSYRQ